MKQKIKRLLGKLYRSIKDKKLELTLMILCILFFFLVRYQINGIKREYNKVRDSVESFVGKKITLNNDTLSIIDYSIIEKTFTVENGQKVSFKFVEENILE